MSDVLSMSQVKVPGTARSKDDAIREAGGILVDAGAVTPDYIDAMFEREKSVSTYMGNYLAILSRVAILFSDTDEVDKLLAAQSAEELFELLNAVNED